MSKRQRDLLLFRGDLSARQSTQNRGPELNKRVIYFARRRV